MDILIVYGTSEGQTRKISRFMGKLLEEKGHQVSLADASDNPPSPDEYDLVFIGSSIHIHEYQQSITDYVTKHVGMLNSKPSAFFSVCLAVASDIPEEHEEARQIAADFLEATGWKADAVEQIAGALRYTQYNYFKRLIMRMIAKKEGGSTDTKQNHEYTDWEAVKAFALRFVGG